VVTIALPKTTKFGRR